MYVVHVYEGSKGAGLGHYTAFQPRSLHRISASVITPHFSLGHYTAFQPRSLHRISASVITPHFSLGHYTAFQPRSLHRISVSTTVPRQCMIQPCTYGKTAYDSDIARCGRAADESDRADTGDAMDLELSHSIIC